MTEGGSLKSSGLEIEELKTLRSLFLCCSGVEFCDFIGSSVVFSRLFSTAIGLVIEGVIELDSRLDVGLNSGVVVGISPTEALAFSVVGGTFEG